MEVAPSSRFWAVFEFIYDLILEPDDSDSMYLTSYIDTATQWVVVICLQALLTF